MNIVLWIVQAVLAVLFFWSGVEKLARPRQALAGKYPWVGDSPPATVPIAGAAEVLAAIGLVVPTAVGVAPMLTPLAAACLALLMALAAGLHVRRHEAPAVVLTVGLLAVAAFVAWARFGPYGW